VTKTFHIASGGGWDYIAVGPGNNRLYVSHGTQVNILDEKNGDSIGVIPNTTGVHGIAFDKADGKGYTSNGRLNTVTVFDLMTNQVLAQIPTGTNPDAIMYEPFSRTIITCNGRSKNLSIIDPGSNKVIDSIDVGGKPETAVSDEAGKVYVNIEDKNEIIEIDIKARTVTHHWPLAPGTSPSGLAMDTKTRRLFAGCDNKMLIVLDANSGAVVAQPAIGDGCDGVGFDPKWKNIFASCGQGVVSVIHEESAGKFTKVEDVPTKRGARTITVDEQNHEVFLPTAEFEQTTKPGERRPAMIPGTFQVLVLAK
jgi:YVTN family beta-propeller protein